MKTRKMLKILKELGFAFHRTRKHILYRCIKCPKTISISRSKHSTDIDRITFKKIIKQLHHGCIIDLGIDNPQNKKRTK